MKTLLRSIIIDGQSLTVESVERILSTLSRDTTALVEFWEDDYSHELFISGFGEYGPQLIMFLQFILDLTTTREVLAAKVAAGFLQHIIVPLIRSDFDEVVQYVDVVVDLSITVLQLFRDRVSSFTSTIGELVYVAAERRSVVERLVANETGHAVLKFVLGVNRMKLDYTLRILQPESLPLWTEKLLELTTHCDRHQLKTERVQWRRLNQLVTHLQEIYDKSRAAMGQAISATTAADISKVPLASMTALKKDDKRSSARTKAHKAKTPAPIIILSAEDTASLTEFGLKWPTSVVGILNTKEHLETTCLAGILLKVFQTFPCNACCTFLRGREPGIGGADGMNFVEETVVPDIGPWRILMTGRALDDMEKLASSGLLSDVERTLKEIASGDWRGRSSLSNPYVHDALILPIYKGKYGSNGRILWNVSLALDISGTMASQVVKVWCIGDHKEVKKYFKIIAKSLKTHSRDFIEECKGRTFHEDSGVYVPRLSGEEILDTHAEEGLKGLNRDEALSLHQAMITGKTYALSESIFKALALEGSNIEVPFELSKPEAFIVTHHETPAFVQGRSGTGKTSCLVFRLFTRFLARNTLNIEKQVFITKSPVLAKKIRDYINSLIKCRLITIEDATPDDYKHTVDSLSDMKIADLRDSKLPLVCTFEELLSIIENTIQDSEWTPISQRYRRSSIGISNFHRRSSSIQSDFERPIFHRRSSSIQSDASIPRRPSREVDFETFKYDYWPSLQMSVRMVPDVVFSEILGVIKGSKQSIAELRDMTLEEYLSNSTRFSSFFQGEGDRYDVYRAFQSYENIKRRFGDWDGIDKARVLLSSLRENRVIRKQVQDIISEIYVDEIQDIRMIEIYILFNLVRNPLGITLAGDTAQCISKDSTFRFQDVKSTFYEHFQPFATFGKNRSSATPTLFQLTENYRSHQGILGLASIMTEYLWKLFPESVDKMPVEKAKYGGPLPMVLVDFDESYLKSIFEGFEGSESSRVFGADQVVIVRDPASAEAAKALVGEEVLTLTIMQSKGLEFEDVLLFEFFSDPDSEDESGFRALAKGLGGNDISLDKTRYAGLCSQLKNLYVAITRCQSRLWIYEKDRKAIESFLDVCLRTGSESNPLIEIISPESPDAQVRWAEVFKNEAKEDPKLWKQRGHEMLAKCEYKIAKMCFLKAKSKQGEALADGYIARADVNREWSTNKRQAQKRLRDAVGFFREADALREAAKSLEDWGFYEEAAETWVEAEDFKRAAELYEKLRAFKIASDLYHLAKKYDDAANALQKGQLFESLLGYMSLNKDQMSPRRYNSLSRLCKILCEKGQLSPDFGVMLVKATETDEEKEKFFRDNGLDDDLVEILLKREKFADAWEILIRNEKFEEALIIISPAALIELKSEREVKQALHYSLAKIVFSDNRKPVNYKDLVGYVGFENQLLPQWKTVDHPLYESVLNSWEIMVDLLLHGLENPGSWSVGRETIEDIMVRELFDLLCFTKTYCLLEWIDKISDLPFETLHSAMELVKSLITNNMITAPMQILFGIRQSSLDQLDQDSLFEVLSWSVFDMSGEVKGNDMIQMMKSELAVSVVETAFTVLDTADELYQVSKPSCRNICWNFATRGSCDFGEDCRRAHRSFPTMNECESEIKDAQRVTKSACALMFFYYRCPEYLKESYIQNFLGTKRRWLERYLFPATFYTQAVQIPLNYFFEENKIQPGVYLLSGLEELLFYRFKKNEIGEGLSVLLEQLFLADFLGGRAIRRLGQIFYGILHYRYPSPVLRTSLHGMREIMRILFILQTDRPELREISGLVERLRALDISVHYTAFHSIMWFFDKLILELLLRFNVEDLVLPWSWIYRFKIHRRTKAKPIIASAAVSKCLANVIFSLLILEEGLKDSDRRISFEFSGRKAPYKEGSMVRRTQEAILIGLSNMQLHRPYNFQDVMSPALNQALTLWLQRNRVQSTTGYGLLRHYNRTFRPYGEKERLVRLELRPTIAHMMMSHVQTVLSSLCIRPPVFTMLTQQELQGTLPSATTSRPDIAQASSEQPNEDNASHSDQEAKAAETIIAFWRQRKERFLWQKEYMKSPQGEALSAIKAVVKAHSSCLPTTQHMRFILLLHAHGPSTYLSLRQAFKRLRDFEAECKEALNALDISSFDRIDAFQEKTKQCITTLNEKSPFAKYRTTNISHGPEIADELRKIKRMAQKAIDDVAKAENKLKEMSRGQ